MKLNPKLKINFDKKDKPTGVLMSIKDFNKILDQIEDLEDRITLLKRRGRKGAPIPYEIVKKRSLVTMQNKFKGYKIDFSADAVKDLKKLDPISVAKINKKLTDLTGGAENVDIKKIKGEEETYRLRWGDYRVVFVSKKHIITILVVKIAHRKEVYRNY